MLRFPVFVLGLLALLCSAAAAPPQLRSSGGECPGYKASNIKTGPTGLTADLSLAGPPCNTYGTDLENLRLEVTYETGKCLQFRL